MTKQIKIDAANQFILKFKLFLQGRIMQKHHEHYEEVLQEPEPDLEVGGQGPRFGGRPNVRIQNV